jgi:hypothetical protein
MSDGSKTEVTKMAEEQLNNEVVNEPETVEVPENKPEVKTFTQDELDKIVADRIARERKKLEKFADYDDIKTKASEYEKALEEKRLAELSAQERAEELAKKFETERNDYANQLKEYQTKVERQQVVNEFIKAAPGVNIPADRIDAALKLADLSAVTVGEDGVDGLTDVMKTLVEQYSFLADVKKPQKPIGEATNNSNEVVDKTAEQLLRDAAEKVKRTGKIEDQIAYAALKNKLGK